MSRYMTKRRKIAIRNKCCAIIFCLSFTAGTALSTIFYQTNNTIQIPTVEVSDEAPPLEFKPLLSVVEPPEIKEKAVIKDSYDVPNGIEEVYDHIVNVTGNKGLGLNDTVIGLVDEWCEFYGYEDTHKAKAIISCEGGNKSGVCNYEYGCDGGQGHFQWIPSSWNNICVKELGLTDVFDSSQNIQCGIYTLQKYGDSHWGLAPTIENPDGSWWGSRRCWKPKL